MMQNAFITLASILLVTLVLSPSSTDGACNVCNEFGIACVNRTSFNICSSGQRTTDRVYTCPSNKICTDTKLKCAEETVDQKAACDSNEGCGICDGNKIFACTSRSTFVQCNGSTRTSVTGNCSTGLVCDSRGGEICKNECNRPAVLECDMETPS